MGIEQKRFPMRIEGHRGAGYLEPENSVRAFQRAIDLGIDGVELDIWLTKDGMPIVVHGLPGGFVEFQNGIKKVINEIDLETLKTYTLKDGEKVPTLEEVLDVCKSKMHLNIEIKESKEEVIDKILTLLEEKDMFDQITFSSFKHYHRERLASEVNKRGIQSKVAFGFLLSIDDFKLPNYEIAQPGDSINLDIRFFENNKEECLAVMKIAQDNRVKVKFWCPMAYTEEHKFYDEFVNLNVDTFITNSPSSMIDYFTNSTVCP